MSSPTTTSSSYPSLSSICEVITSAAYNCSGSSFPGGFLVDAIYPQDQSEATNCASWILVPGEVAWQREVRAVLYSLALGYCFLGLAAITGCYMVAMENIVSQTRRVKRWDPLLGREVEREEKKWNPAIADITMLALGTCAPQISLAIIDALQSLGQNSGGGVGAGTILGSAAFNVFPILAACVLVPPPGVVRHIDDLALFVVELSWSLWAYVWLALILQVWTPNEITIWEAAGTLLQMPLLMLHAYAQHQKWPYVAIRFPSSMDKSAASATAVPGASDSSAETSTRRDELGNTKSSLGGEAAGSSRLQQAAGGSYASVGKDGGIADVASRGAKDADVDERWGPVAPPMGSFTAKREGSKPGRTADDEFFSTGGYGFRTPGRASQGRRRRSLSSRADDEGEGEGEEEEAAVEMARRRQTFTLAPKSGGNLPGFSPPFDAGPRGFQSEGKARYTRRHTTQGWEREEWSEREKGGRGREEVDDKRRGMVGEEELGPGAGMGGAVQNLMERFEGGERGLTMRREGSNKADDVEVVVVDGEDGERGRGSKIQQTAIRKKEKKERRRRMFLQWKGQIWRAMSVSLPISRKHKEPSAWQLLMHAIAFPWKCFFAVCVPPPGIAHGWAAFLVSILIITGISAVVIELANLFGCVTGADSFVIAISVLATGTSIPDLIASVVAADHSDTADSSVANINASNCIIVFVGLGLPWMISTVYNRIVLDENLMMATTGLTFSLVVYFITVASAIIFLMGRRFILGGELGGPKGWAVFSSCFFMFLWFAYIFFTSLGVYNLI